MSSPPIQPIRPDITELLLLDDEDAPEFTERESKAKSKDKSSDAKGYKAGQSWRPHVPASQGGERR